MRLALIALLLCGCSDLPSDPIAPNAVVVPPAPVPPIVPAAVVAENPEPEPIAEPPEPPRWTHHATADKMTDERIDISSLKSLNTVNLQFPYEGEQRATIFLRTKAGKQEVGFRIEKGQMFPTDLAIGQARANIRVDGVPLVSKIAGTTGYNTELCFLLHEQLPDLLRTGSELRIEVELYNETNKVFVFDLTSGR